MNLILPFYIPAFGKFYLAQYGFRTVVIRMLENVQQATIGPLLRTTFATGTQVYADEHDIYNRLSDWGYAQRTVCHSHGEYARDEDGDGFHEIHVNTIEGFWSLLRSCGICTIIR